MGGWLRRVLHIHTVVVSDEERRVRVFVPGRRMAEKLYERLVTDMRENPEKWRR